MLAGHSSTTLLSPRHRLSEPSSSQFKPCHFPSMSTQRLDLPCSFARKDTSRSQPVKLLEPKPNGCSLKQNIRLPPLATTSETTRRDIKDEFWGKDKSLKRFAEKSSFEKDDDDDASFIYRPKRKKRSENSDETGDDSGLGQLGSGSFWLNTAQFSLSLSCSGEEGEERACFMPGALISPPLPIPNAPWADSVMTMITKFGDKDPGPSHRPVPEASGPSTSSEAHQILTTNPNPSQSGPELGNVGGLQNPIEGAELGAEYNPNEDEEGFELISFLMACVEAVGSNNIVGINHFIAKLGDLASPRGSPISRLIAYFTEALALRVTRVWPNTFHITIPRELDPVDDESGTSLRLLNQVSPIPKFIHFTSNEIILKAFEGKDRVHIIDFDVKEGLQWTGLFQSLASRPNPPAHVRITGIGESKQDLIETGDRLTGFAGTLNLPFEFHPVVDKLDDVRLWMLHVKERETVAVNCVFQLHKMLHDDSGVAITNFLGLIRSTNPIIVLVAEQEAEHNEPSLESRVSNTLKYYSAIFDSIDLCLPRDSAARIKIEENFAREIRNVIACEGSGRNERHERFEKWRELMERGGYRSLGIHERELNQSQMLLKMHNCENFSVEMQGQDRAGLTLSWLDQPLYTVSAWAPVDLGGASSSFSLLPR
ncbi:GRAS family transcription factor [Actinidia rufa]|uniref:GRAS family transcription factor n=1 Tax=Actinidia rufa TaxID=165716 RepID=A0A7J0G8L8_9ERIC|nr:GRAS family transcription factor [Actinidia rufa]